MSDEKTTSMSAYEKHIKKMENNGDYFVFSKYYVKILNSKLTALFLQDIIDIADSPDVIKTSVDGKEYFQATVKFLVNSKMEWKNREQKLHLGRLIKKGYVKTKKMGIPGKRYISINFEKLEKDLEIEILKEEVDRE